MVIVNNFTRRWYSYPQIKSLFPPQQNTNNVRIKNRLATYIYDVQEVKTVVKYRNDDRSTSRSLIINSKDKKTKYIKIYGLKGWFEGHVPTWCVNSPINAKALRYLRNVWKAPRILQTISVDYEQRFWVNMTLLTPNALMAYLNVPCHGICKQKHTAASGEQHWEFKAYNLFIYQVSYSW